MRDPTPIEPPAWFRLFPFLTAPAEFEAMYYEQRQSLATDVGLN